MGLGGQKTPIADTGTRQITLQLAVPEALQAAERTFRIIRVHEGAADVLDDLDSDPATITFRTNLFSTYAIVYTDGPAATDEPAATETPAPTDEPAPTETPAPTDEPAATDDPAPTATRPPRPCPRPGPPIPTARPRPATRRRCCPGRC